MEMSVVFVVAASFLASAVEMVEALTIVLATGVTRGWRSSLVGVGVALLVLAAAVAALGPALDRVPIDLLRLLVGGLLLIFGLQWWRKALLRYGGLKAMHDEEAVFLQEREAALQHEREIRGGLDWYAFTLCFKGVLLEGLEVAFIVVTFGATSKALGPAALGALAALLAVLLAGLVLHRPLSQVPENTLKFAVGILLSAFGTFWAAEGAGAHWPGADTAILGLVALYLGLSYLLVKVLRGLRQAKAVS